MPPPPSFTGKLHAVESGDGVLVGPECHTHSNADVAVGNNSRARYRLMDAEHFQPNSEQFFCLSFDHFEFKAQAPWSRRWTSVCIIRIPRLHLRRLISCRIK